MMEAGFFPGQAAMNYVTEWFRRHLANPQVVLLVLVISAIAGVIALAGDMLGPVLAAVVIAYLLQGIVSRLENRGVPHLAAVLAAFLGFVAALLVLVFLLLPQLTRQLTQLLQQAPQILAKALDLAQELPKKYPGFISQESVNELAQSLSGQLLGWSQDLVRYGVTQLVTAITILVYLILVPFLVFFMMRDKQRLVDWFLAFVPQDRQLLRQVWIEVDGQIGNYVRGKVWEIIVVGVVTYICFSLLNLQYAMLLAVMTGFSVLIPYIGAAVVALPVALVSFFQSGIGPEFYSVIIAYGVIQALDGNVLAPLLFSEVVDLHPVAIIASILVFGGLWGFWGVFFAIPLATVIQAVLRAWPRADVEADPTAEAVSDVAAALPDPPEQARVVGESTAK